MQGPQVSTLTDDLDDLDDEVTQSQESSLQFSGEDVDDVSRIIGILRNGRNVLISSGHIRDLHEKLAQQLHILMDGGPNSPSQPSKYDPDDELQYLILDNWIEELLKFLALKTIIGDNTEPCQLLPGYAIGIGWKIFMMIPSTYSRVCLAMGNQCAIDHHPCPCDTNATMVKETHKMKRYHATLRAYESYFEQQPPCMYWRFHKKEMDYSLLSSIRSLCGIDASFILNPLATKHSNPVDLII